MTPLASWALVIGIATSVLAVLLPVLWRLEATTAARCVRDCCADPLAGTSLSWRGEVRR